MDTISIELPREILDSARLSVPELKLEIAATLYARRRLALGKARELAGVSLWEFRQFLAAHQIAPHLDRAALRPQARFGMVETETPVALPEVLHLGVVKLENVVHPPVQLRSVRVHPVVGPVLLPGLGTRPPILA